MSAAVRTNVFALLNDDVEDAGEASVNTEALATKKPAPAATSTTSTTEPESKKETSAPPSRKPSAPAKGGSARGRGGRTGGNVPGHEDKDFELGQAIKGREHRIARHSDRRDHPEPQQVYRANKTREFDRKNPPGRGREAAKKGGGGKFTFGNSEEEAREGESAAHLNPTAPDEAAAEAIADTLPGEQYADEEKRNIMGDEEDKDKEDEDAEKAEPEEKDITLEEFERQKAESKAAVDEVFASGKARQIATDDGLKPLKKEDEDDELFVPAAKKGNKSRKNGAVEGDKKNPTAEFFTQTNSPKPSSSGGPRRRDGGGRSTRPRAPAAPRLEDLSAFPSLGS